LNGYFKEHRHQHHELMVLKRIRAAFSPVIVTILLNIFEGSKAFSHNQFPVAKVYILSKFTAKSKI
jgi:hypothetical protein